MVCLLLLIDFCYRLLLLPVLDVAAGMPDQDPVRSQIRKVPSPPMVANVRPSGATAIPDARASGR